MAGLPMPGLMKSRSIILFLAVAGMAITATVSLWLFRLEMRSATDAFHREVEGRAEDLQRELQIGIEALFTLREMVRYVDSLPPLVFDDVAASILSRNAHILALEWLPRVENEARPAFEAQMMTYLDGFQIRERGADDQRVAAAPRTTYFPVGYVYPRYTNTAAIGFDMMSEPQHAQALLRARDSGALAASQPLQLRWRARVGKGLVMVVPVFFGQPGTEQQRRDALRGFVRAVFEAEALARRTLPASAGHLFLSIDDVTDVSNVINLYQRGEAGDLALHPVTLPEIGGRRLQVTMAPSQRFLADEVSALPYAVAAVGVLMVMIVCGYLYLLQRRGAVIEAMVRDRTAELSELNEKLARMSVTDPLTGLSNRRALDEYLEQEWARALREQEPLSVALIDVDHFKRINDSYGHDAGDLCLRELGVRLRGFFRRSVDLVSRFGGEEFAVVMPNTSAAVQGKLEAFREQMGAAPVRLADGDNLMMTISAGVATCVPAAELTPRDLVRAADAALYEAKRAGRNRVCVAESVTPLTTERRGA